MANSYLTSNLIAPRAVAILKAINSFIRLGNREWENMFIAKNYAPGDTINLRLDNYYNVQRGDVVTAEDIVEASIPMTMQPLFSVPILYTPTDLQRDIVSFTDEFVLPAVRAISAQINAAIYQNSLTTIAHYTGDISAPLNTIQSIASVNPLMDSLQMNNYGRNMVIDPYNYYQMSTSSDLRNSFLPSLNQNLTIEMKLGRLVDFEIFKDTSINSFYSGTWAPGTGITVNVAVQNGSTIVIGGLTPGATINTGDLFTLGTNAAPVYEWNPVSQVPLSTLKTLTVTAPAVANGSGIATVSIYPALINSDTRINFFTPGTSPNQVPAGTVVTPVLNSTSGYINNIAFTDRGLALALPPLVPMDSPTSFVHTDPTSGISMRISKTAEVLQNKNILRLDAQMACTWVNDQSVRVVSKLGL